jgi:hypothetical protein
MQRLSVRRFLSTPNDDVDVFRIELDHRARFPESSAAIKRGAEPPNGSSTISRLLDKLRIARSTSATA